MSNLDHLTDKQRYWLGHIQSARQSSLSLAAYARAQGLPQQALYQWQRLFKQKGLGSAPAVKPATAFAQVQLMTFADSADPSIRLHLGQSVVLESNRWPEPAWLARLVLLLDQSAAP